MKLYGYYRSSASYRIRIMLHSKGIPFDYVAVMLNEGEQLEASFRKINPMGFVPVLVDGENIISQSPAIGEYLEESYPEPHLLPNDKLQRAQVREIVSLIGCDIHPIQNLRILKYLQVEFDQNDEGVAVWCRHWIAAGFDAVEAVLKTRSSEQRFCIGDTLSLADVWLIPQMLNAKRFELDLDPYPTLRSIDAHCQTLAGFKAAHPTVQPDTPA